MRTKRKFSLVIAMVILALMISPIYAKTKAFIGVYLKDLTEKDYKELEIKGNYGILITGIIEDTAAEKADLKEDDVLIGLNDEKIYTLDQLTKMLTSYKPDEEVKLTVVRDGKEKSVKMKLGKKEIPEKKKKAYLGVYLDDLSDEDYEEYGIKDNYGVLINDVVEEGPAEKGGIESDDVILKIDETKIYTQNQVTKMLKTMKPEQKIKLQISRDKKIKEFDVVLGENENWFDFDFEFDFDFDDKIINLNHLPGEMSIIKNYVGDTKYIGVVLSDKITEKDGKRSEQIVIEEIIKESPAEKAGLMEGDEIIKADGKKIKKLSDLTKKIKKKEVGEKIELEILRNKKNKTIKVEIAERENLKDVKMKKCEVYMEDGNVRVLLDGEEKSLLDLEDMKDNINIIKIFNDGECEEECEIECNDKCKGKCDLHNDFPNIKKIKKIKKMEGIGDI